MIDKSLHDTMQRPSSPTHIFCAHRHFMYIAVMTTSKYHSYAFQSPPSPHPTLGHTPRKYTQAHCPPPTFMLGAPELLEPILQRPTRARTRMLSGRSFAYRDFKMGKPSSMTPRHLFLSDAAKASASALAHCVQHIIWCGAGRGGARVQWVLHQQAIHDAEEGGKQAIQGMMCCEQDCRSLWPGVSHNNLVPVQYGYSLVD